MNSVWQLIRYFGTVAVWAGRRWWSIRKWLGVTVIPAAALSILVGWLVHGVVLEQVPNLKDKIGEPTTEVILWVMYGLVPAVVIGLIVLLVLVFVAPSQIDKEKDAQIQELDSRLRELAGQIQPFQKLVVQYDPATNFVPNTPENGAQARVIIRAADAVDNVRVKVDSLVPLTKSTRTAKRQTEYTAQFSGMPLRLERGQQGMSLPSGGFVEAWVAEHVRGDEFIWFHASEPQGRYKVPVGEYELRITVTGNDSAPGTFGFLVKATKRTTLVFEKRELWWRFGPFPIDLNPV